MGTSTPQPAGELEPRVHRLLLGNLYVLMGLALWLLWLALPSTGSARALTALLLTLPLAIPLRGLRQRRRYTAVWTTFLLAPYLALGLTEVVANPVARTAAALVIAASFTAAVLLIAWLRLSRRAPVVADRTHERRR